MRAYSFTWAEDPNDTGLTGWLSDNHSTFNPNTNGIGVAHDVLEHFPGDDDSPAAELMAFGAMRWGRGEMGLFPATYGTEYAIGTSVDTIYGALTQSREPILRISVKPFACNRIAESLRAIARIDEIHPHAVIVSL